MVSRFEVAGYFVDAKSPVQAARIILGRPLEGSSVVVTEWTGKETVVVAGRKGRLKAKEEGRV